MANAGLNLEVYEGEDFQFTPTIKDSSGNVILLATRGGQVKMNLVKRLTQTVTDLEIEATEEADEGTCKITMTKVQTQALDTGLYIYVIHVEFSDNTEYVAEVGRMFVRKRGDL